MTYDQRLVLPIGLANMLAVNALAIAARTTNQEEEDEYRYRLYDAMDDADSSISRLGPTELGLVVTHLLDYAQLNFRFSLTLQA